MGFSFYILITIILLFLIIAFYFIVSETTKAHYEHEQREIKRAGDEGERIFNNLARQILNKDDIHLNNIVVETTTDVAEIDNLIINKNGIFIIEVKNYNGKLIGNIDDYTWTKRKISPGGNEFIKEVKNPIKQMRRQTWVLSQYLKDNSIRIKIKHYAYFVNKNSPISDDCIIDDICELEKAIHKEREKTYNQQTIDKTVKLLTNKVQ